MDFGINQQAINVYENDCILNLVYFHELKNEKNQFFTKMWINQIAISFAAWDFECRF